MKSGTSVAAILKHPDQWTGKPATVRGWVRTRRDSKAGVSFVNLSDGSGFDPLQLVVPNTLGNYASDVLKLTAGCAIEAEGTIVAGQGKAAAPGAAQARPPAPEMQVSSLRVHGFVDDPDTYPIQPKAHTMEFLREVAHLRPRTNTFGALGRVRHTMAMAVHRYFHENGFFWIHTPIITASDCEGAGAMFRVSALDLANPPRTPEGAVDFSKDFFGKDSHLTVSGQLNVECWCLALSKVYTFGPTFRAENSNTSRHLAEFWMIEPEIAFADIHADADCAEGLLKAVFTAVLSERADDMRFFAERVDKECVTRLEKFVAQPFERITYTEAIALLEKAAAGGTKFEFAPHWGMDMQSEHERYLTEQVFGKPVVVINYPKEIKAFYMRLNDDGKTVAAMDVLAPGIGEIIGGSQREERLSVLDARLDEMKLDKSAYWWYRDLRRYGTVPHAGFGLGFERTIAYATGLANVRDCIPFPRTPNNCTF